MWLRDAANWRTAGVRVLLYGYDTTLVHSESFQNIDDIGAELGSSISGIRSRLCPVGTYAHIMSLPLSGNFPPSLLIMLQYRVRSTLSRGQSSSLRIAWVDLWLKRSAPPFQQNQLHTAADCGRLT